MSSDAGWTPPDDPNLAELASTAYRMWEMDQPTVIALDTETRGLEYHDRAFGASVAWVSDDAIQGRKVYGAWFDFERIDGREAVRRIASHAQVIVGHNLKFDLHKLAHEDIGINHAEWHDTECMAHLLDEHRRKGLKDLMVSVLDWNDTVTVDKRRKNKETGEMEPYTVEVPREKWELDEAKKWAKKHHGLDSIEDVGYHLLPRGTLVPYAIMDAVGTYHLGAVLHPQILAYPDLTELYNREMELTRVIAGMERAGMGTDQAYVEQSIGEYRRRVLHYEAQIEGLVGKPVRTGKMSAKERPNFFNPASPDEIAKYFEAVEGYRRESYDAEALKLIEHPLASTLLDYRGDAKILQTYLEPLRRECGDDGIFHMSMRQHGTVSGRTSNGAERGDQ